MKLYINEGYGTTHTIYSNIENASVLAAFTIGFYTMVMMSLWVCEMVSYSEGIIAMVCMFMVMGVFALVFNIAMERASRAFHIHLDEIRASRK